MKSDERTQMAFFNSVMVLESERRRNHVQVEGEGMGQDPGVQLVLTPLNDIGGEHASCWTVTGR